MSDTLPLNKIIVGSTLDVMRTWPSDSIHCVVTSPPYWGLRDYGVDEQIGLEATPEEFVAKMVEVFRDVRRVLRPDGVCWVNLGDSYNGSGGVGGDGKQHTNQGSVDRPDNRQGSPTLKPKDLVGIPWRVALALQADGWYLRQDIIWHKPNPMPESVTDRCTKAHEYIFLLTKSARYYYDAEAVKEEQSEGTFERFGNGKAPRKTNPKSRTAETGTVLANASYKDATPDSIMPDGKRNRRSVWTVPTAPYKGAHFATFPPALIEPCILAGTSAEGCCPSCGTPWERVVESTKEWASGSGRSGNPINGKQDLSAAETNSTPDVRMGPVVSSTTVGWQPICRCPRPQPKPVPCVVFDPFMGSGTVAEVARRNGCHYVGTELNPEYAKLCRKRLRQGTLLVTEAV